MNVHYSIVLVALITFCLVGCENVTEPPANAFDIRSVRIYRYTVYDTSGSVTSMSFDTLLIHDTISKGKETVFFGDNTSAILEPAGNSWVMAKYHLNICECATFTIPVKKNDTAFKNMVPARLHDSIFNAIMTIFIKDTNQNITVPSGSYSCFVYQYRINDIPVEIGYISTAIGPIRKEFYSSKSNTGELYLQSIRELVSIE
jgi:hypothetical protein